jgi:hypothetical protein
VVDVKKIKGRAPWPSEQWLFQPPQFIESGWTDIKYVLDSLATQLRRAMFPLFRRIK